MSKLSIGESIVRAIVESPLSDADLGEKVGVSRNTIRLWRTQKTPYIRKSNLVSLSNVLEKNPIFNLNGVVEFAELNEIITDDLNIEDVNLKTNDTQKLITTLSNTNALLVDQLKEKNDYIDRLQSKLDELDKTIHDFAKPKFSLEVNYSTIQVIVDANSGRIMNCTTLYANLFKKSVKEMINDVNVRDLCHPDDMWMIESETPEIQQEQMIRMSTEGSTWKVIGHEGVYYHSIVTFFEEQGIIKIEMKKSTLEEYEKNCKWFKSLLAEHNGTEAKT